VCDVMVIGAAVGQLPLIRKVQAMGHRALVVSCPGPYPGLDEADEALLVDIRDWDEIGRMGRDRNVAAVVTDQTDVCLPTAAAVAEELGLPGVPSALVSLFTNKQKLRALCRAREILTPCSYTVRSLSDLAEASKALACPFVLKPVDSDGSRGVQIVRDLSGLGQAYEKSLVFSRSGVLLAESYIAGVEVVVEALVHNGRVVNLVVGTSENVGIDGLFVPCARLFPAELPTEIRDRLHMVNTRLYEGHGGFFSIVHAEYIISAEDNQPYLIDAHMRGGGAYIASHIVPLVTEIDLYDLYIRWACRERIELPERVAFRRHAGYMCFVLPEGRLLDSMDSGMVTRLPGVKHCDLSGLVTGLQLPAPKDKRSRWGPIIICAEPAEGLEHVRRRVEQTVQPRVQTPDGVAGPIWR
jgi:hypothetical protein